MISTAFGFWLPEVRIRRRRLAMTAALTLRSRQQTRGLSIEEMDILFGTTTQEARDANIARLQKQGDVQTSEKDRELEHEHVSLPLCPCHHLLFN